MINCKLGKYIQFSLSYTILLATSFLNYKSIFGRCIRFSLSFLNDYIRLEFFVSDSLEGIVLNAVSAGLESDGRELFCQFLDGKDFSGTARRVRIAILKQKENT